MTPKKSNIRDNHKIIASSKGFTLIEMLVVLGVIAMVIALAIPAYNYVGLRGRVTSAKGTAAQVATEVQAFISQNGSGAPPITEGVGTGVVPASEYGGVTGGTAANVSAAATLDGVLLNAGLLAHPIRVTMGNQNYTPANYPGGPAVTWNATTQGFSGAAAPTLDYTAVTRVECTFVDTTATPGVNGTAGINFKLDGTNSLQSGARVVYLIIKSVAANDAYALAQEVDGANMVGASSAVAQTSGSVAYAAPVSGITTVFYYITSL